MFPPFDAALFWNTLFDKGLLAAAILLLGYVANRWLEHYRYEMAIATEGAKLRLNHIGALWEQMNGWEAEVKGLFIEFAAESIMELRAAGVPGLPPESEGSVSAILKIAHMQIPAEVQDRVIATVGPKKAEHVARGHVLWREIDRQRFWLQEQLFQSMKKYHLAVQHAEATLELTPEAIEAGTAALDSLDARRHDVESAIAMILGRGDLLEREPKKRGKAK